MANVVVEAQYVADTTRYVRNLRQASEETARFAREIPEAVQATLDHDAVVDWRRRFPALADRRVAMLGDFPVLDPRSRTNETPRSDDSGPIHD